ncbi:hypothetical protein ASE04_29505 [Rhizobium sp. Root708]|uniref:hypothetical protein n=1 Tax=Rhizobium sp. Root708 TaxID=1736592 RepID=UPI0006FACB57|nr:hypothetical protein [Rhizobium sp. Root708]KRB53468.1 hypothetical protein ASE04_29505 [Rhizobium sp. Root708]
MADKDALLAEILHKMLADNTKISFGAVVRHSDGAFRNASDLTRIESRRLLVNGAIVQQHQLRSKLEGIVDLDVETLSIELAKSRANEERLERQKWVLSSALWKLTSIMTEAGRIKMLEYMRLHAEIFDELEKDSSIPPSKGKPVD